MLKEDQIYIGNKIISDVNFKKFKIVDIKNDNGTEFVVLKDNKGKKHDITLERFKSSLFSELRW